MPCNKKALHRRLLLRPPKQALNFTALIKHRFAPVDPGIRKEKTHSLAKEPTATDIPPTLGLRAFTPLPSPRVRPGAARGTNGRLNMAGDRPSPIHPDQVSQKTFMGRTRFDRQSEPAPGSAESKPTAKIGTGLDWRALDEFIRESLRVEHYSYRTEQTYVSWIRRFVLFHHWKSLLRWELITSRPSCAIWPWKNKWPLLPKIRR